MLVSVYEDEAANRLHVSAFDPVASLSYSTVVESGAWTAQGYGSELWSLDAKARQQLVEAVISGLTFRTT